MLNFESTYIDEKEVLIRLCVATVLGGIIGMEREQKEWVAGLRTHILVAVGSTLAMMVSIHGYGDVAGKKGFEIDPSRVAAQVVSGVGFLGAGTIIFLKREVIKGLTTAASIWSLAVVGLAVGGGMYWAAVLTTFLVLFVLGGIKWIEKRFFNRGNCTAVHFKMPKGALSKITAIEAIFAKHKIPFDELTYTTDETDRSNDFALAFYRKQSQGRILKALEEMQENGEILKIRFKL
ncbi:MgtC/SapB family protein [Pedobacter montanisoli]|uniref:MgtC/SapB family protein n=1 Tax=Pedobacter montanisoli TaxID=2923277 RepID=A0ABS9ZZH7_9SPHI|nr:MgtC/SapB family protein [Pedobacter montanisoli]MCJ0743709.1 MgtC/SapB family protein [Pedobacter montanisoli]